MGRKKIILGGFKLVLVMLLAWPWSIALGDCAGVMSETQVGRRETGTRGKLSGSLVNRVMSSSASDEAAVLQSESEESEEWDSTGSFGVDLSWLATCGAIVRLGGREGDSGRGPVWSGSIRARRHPLRC